MCPLSPSCNLQKKPSSPFQFGQEGNMPGNSIERRPDLFAFKIAKTFPIPTIRNSMMNTFFNS